MRRFSAMFTLILILSGMAVAGLAGTVVAVSHDGYHRTPTRRS